MLKKCLCSLLLFATIDSYAGDKLIGTAAVNHIEGSAGGGLIPWAVLSGYATDNQWGGSAFMSRSDVDDYSLQTFGFALNYQDRLEVSFSKLEFGIDAGLPDISMNVIGAKYRLYGDVIYSNLPQISIGIQHKTVLDFAIPSAVGALDDSGTDIYLSAAKVWLDGIGHRTVLLNLNARMSKANQIGLLGFGTLGDDDYDITFEAAFGVFLNRNWLIGTEYKQKSDRLSAVKEDDWHDVFITYLPNKSFTVTAAYINLGTIAGSKDQSGYYLSIQGSF